MMSPARTLSIATAAFIAGAVVSQALPIAFAEATAAAPLTARIIDVNALEGEAIGPIVPGTELRSKTLVATDGATIAVQQGNVGKHYHVGNDEIQYIIAGSGTMWVGDAQRAVKPGDLVVVPKGAHHAGTVATSGQFKALAIKLPPQADGDTHFVQ